MNVIMLSIITSNVIKMNVIMLGVVMNKCHYAATVASLMKNFKPGATEFPSYSQASLSRPSSQKSGGQLKKKNLFRCH